MKRPCLHGLRGRRTTKATAVSPVAKHWAVYFMGAIFMVSLQHLCELGATYRPAVQMGSGGMEVADQGQSQI